MNTHEAIISREIFEQAQARLKDIAASSAAKQKKPYTTNIYKGKVFCGHCGGSMHRERRIRKKTDDVYFYICLSNTRKARGSCISYQMPEAALTETLLTVIQSHADAVIGNSMKLRKYTDDIESRHQDVKAELTALRQEADKNGRMFKSLYESLVSGLITADEYRSMRENYETKASDNLSRAAELETRQAELEKQVTKYCELSDLISGVENSGITAALIDCLIDRIRIFSDRSIEVDFSFTSGFELISEVLGDE